MGSRSPRLAVLVAAATLAGCGGGGADNGALPVPPPARTFSLGDFQPARGLQVGKPADVSFAIDTPSGRPLTDYAKGSGPHTGVHLMFVRSDLSAIIHHHPPASASGTIDDTVTFKEPGRYRVVVDAYPGSGPQKNFQLFKWITVAPKAQDKPVPALQAEQARRGLKVPHQGPPGPEGDTASLMTITVTDPH